MPDPTPRPTVSEPDREERGYHGSYCSGTTCHCGLSALQTERIALAAERNALRAKLAAEKAGRRREGIRACRAEARLGDASEGMEDMEMRAEKAEAERDALRTERDEAAKYAVQYGNEVVTLTERADRAEAALQRAREGLESVLRHARVATDRVEAVARIESVVNPLVRAIAEVLP